MMELLVAMVLSSIVIYGAISMFLASRGTASTTNAVGAVTDNGRVALDMLGESVRSGGAMACNATNDIHGTVITAAGPLRQNSILNVGGTPLQLDYNDAFSGFEALGTSPSGGAATLSAMPVAADPSGNDWSGPAGVALDGLLAGRVVQGSDVLAVRETLPQAAPVYTNVDYHGQVGSVTLNVKSVGSLQPLQYAVISDCTASTVFQINAVDPVGLTVTTSGPLSLGGGDLQWDYPQPSAIMPVDMTVYYIAPGRDGDSSLFQYDEWTGAFQELVPDVENMQVLYGIASTTPNQVTQYVTADQVTTFNQVVAVKIAVLAASPPGAIAVPLPQSAMVYQLLDASITAPLDQRLRKVFETTIAVQNAAL